RVAPQHVAIGAGHDLLRPRRRHRLLLAVLRAAADRLAHLRFRPPVVDHAPAVLAHAGSVGLAVEQILVGTADDALGVVAPASAKRRTPAGERPPEDLHRRDLVVQPLAFEVADVTRERPRVPAEAP